MLSVTHIPAKYSGFKVANPRKLEDQPILSKVQIASIGQTAEVDVVRSSARGLTQPSRPSR